MTGQFFTTRVLPSRRKAPLSRLFTSATLCSLTMFLLCSALPAAAERCVRVGYFPFYGLNDYDARGNMRGYGYDYLQQLARYAGWRYEFVTSAQEVDENGVPTGRLRALTYTDCLNMLEKGEIDLLGTVRKTPEREQRFAFPVRDSGMSFGILTVRDEPSSLLEDIHSQKALTIGTLKSSSHNEEFKNYCTKQGFRNIQYREYDTQDSMWRALHETREVDALLSCSLRKAAGERVVLRFDASAHYFIVNRNNQELLDELNEAQEELALHDWSLKDRLYNKYCREAYESVPAFTEQEKSFMAAHAPVRVACNINHEPYQFFARDKLSGVLPALLRHIEKQSGLRFEFLPAASQAEALEMVLNGRAEIISGVARNTSVQGIRQTTPYMVNTISALCRSDRIDPYNSQNTVALVKNGVIPSFISYEKNKLHFFDTALQCIQAVDAGKADLTFLDRERAYFYLTAYNFSGLTLRRVPDEDYALGLGVGEQCAPELYSLLNKTVANLPPRLVDQLIDEALLDAHPPASLSDWVYQNFTLATILLFLLFSLFFACVYYWLANRARKLRTTLLMKKNRELIRATRRAKMADEAKSAFLARMSHDIRTPLNAIIGMNHIAAECPNDVPRVQECLRKANLAARYLLDILNDILDVSGLVSGKIILHPQPFAASELIDSMIALFSEQSRNKRLTFQTDCDGLKKKNYIGDARRICQILNNLLSNAIKFTPQGGTVSFSARENEGNAASGELEFVVEDTGIGMSEEFQRHMFEPFRQSEEGEHAADQSGSGLGLAIVKELTELMNGELDISSEQGRGTRILVRLRLPRADRVSSQFSILPEASEEERPHYAGLRALVAEDNELNQEIIQELLGLYDIEAVLCADGKHALERFVQSPPGYYGIIFEDIRMPRMNGYESAAAIRACGHPDAQTVPIVACSANAYDEDRELAFKSGMDAHLAKPLQLPELEAELKKFLGPGK